MNAADYIDDLPEQAVVEYLRHHPEFFTEHEDLLAKIEVPHAAGSAVSLVEKKLTVLRDENRHLQRKLDDLISIAHTNEKLNQRIQNLIIRLTGAASPGEFFGLLYSELSNEFKTDAIVIRLFEMPPTSLADRDEFVEYDAQIFTLFENLLENNHPNCGRLLNTQNSYLFPNNPMASAVLIPLGLPKANGILAMGSKEVSRFHAGMGTDLLKYMGDMISQLLKLWQRLD